MADFLFGRHAVDLDREKDKYAGLFAFEYTERNAADLYLF